MTFLEHPRGLSTLFFTEMWERFSYYGMRALLILFMTASVDSGGMGLPVERAAVIYGLVTAMAYLAALPGGWVADAITGHRNAVLYGGLLIAAGNLTLAYPSDKAFYAGLAIVIAGTGLLKPNVSAMVGQLYDRGDQRRDSGFSIFYMGINLGAFLAPLVCGFAAQAAGWRTGFLLAGIGMIFGIIQFVVGRARLQGAGELNVPPNRTAGWLLIGVFAALVAAIALGAGETVDAKLIADSSGVVFLAIVVLFFRWMFSRPWAPHERRNLVAITILFTASVVFWSLFEQAGSSMNLFAQRATDNEVFGFTIPAPWYQSINAIFIILLSPLFAVLWRRLGDREPSSPSKFSAGLALAGSGFLILAVGAQLASGDGRVSPAWLLITYLFHTAGELCLSPVGLSAMTKLSPAKVAGMMMGVWFLSISLGNYVGGRVAAYYETIPLHLLFGICGVAALVSAVVLAVLAKRIQRLMTES